MAKWTLASNSSRDKALRDILKAEMNAQPDNVRRHLREVIIAAETFEIEKVRKDALAAIDQLKASGPQNQKDYAWWGKAGQTALALGCITASALGQAQIGIPCVVGLKQATLWITDGEMLKVNGATGRVERTDGAE